MNPSSNPGEFRDFLLDRLSPEQAEAIEERMFQDEAFFADLQDAEDDLIEEYVTDALDSAEAKIFAARIERDPDLRERVALRRALIRTLQRIPAEVARTEPPRATPVRRRMWSRFLVPGFALATVILFFVAYTAEHGNGVPSQATGTAKTASGPAGTQQEATAQATAVLFLPAHGTRGGVQQPSVLHIGSAALVRLELETPSEESSTRWNVQIRDANGTVFSADGLGPRQAGVVSYVVAEVRASLLPPQAYQISLSPQASSSGGVSSSWDLDVVK